MVQAAAEHPGRPPNKNVKIMFSFSSPTLRIRASTTRNLPAGAEGRRRGGGTCKKSQNNYFLKKNIYSFSQAKGIRLMDTKVRKKHSSSVPKICKKKREKMNNKEEGEEIFFSFLSLRGGENFFVTLSDAARKYFGNFQFLTKQKKKKKHEEKKFCFFCQKAIRKAVLFLCRKQEQTSKSPKNGGRFKRRNDFSTNFTIPRPGSFGKLLQKCASRLEDFKYYFFRLVRIIITRQRYTVKVYLHQPFFPDKVLKEEEEKNNTFYMRKDAVKGTEGNGISIKHNQVDSSFCRFFMRRSVPNSEKNGLDY